MEHELITLIYNIGTAVGVSVVISGLAALGAKDVAWDWKKYLYTLGITGLGSLAIIDTIDGGVNAGNLIAVALQIAGASFLGNKLINVATKLKK